MSYSNELEQLLMEVADICDGGQHHYMKDGADIRHDGKTYGEGLFTAYQNFISTDEGGKWYDDAVEENHKMLFGDGE